MSSRRTKRHRGDQSSTSEKEQQPARPGLLDPGVVEPLRDLLGPGNSASLASVSLAGRDLLKTQKHECAKTTNEARRCADPEGWTQIATEACPAHWVSAYCLAAPHRWLIPYLARFAETPLELRVSFKRHERSFEPRTRPRLHICQFEVPLGSNRGVAVRLHGYGGYDPSYNVEPVADGSKTEYRWIQALPYEVELELGTAVRLGLVKYARLVCSLYEEAEMEAFRRALRAIDWKRCSGNAELEVLGLPRISVPWKASVDVQVGENVGFAPTEFPLATAEDARRIVRALGSRRSGSLVGVHLSQTIPVRPSAPEIDGRMWERHDLLGF